MKHMLQMKYPSSWWGAKWREALPSGNGTIGAAVYGGVHDETILLTHEDLWHRSRTQELPDVSGRLPEVRKLLSEGRAAEADGILEGELKDSAYNPKIGSPLPLGDLKIQMPVHMGFRQYRRILDMESGEVAVSWKDGDTSYRRALFVSRPENLVVMEITCSEPSLDVLATFRLHDLRDKTSAVGKVAMLPTDVEVQSDASGWIRYAACNDDETDFGAVARVLPFSSSSAEAPALTAKDGRIHVKGADRVLIVAKLFVQSKRQSAWPELDRQLNNVDMDYQALLLPHAIEHGELFSRVKLDLNAGTENQALSNEELLLDAYQGEVSAAMTEKMWAYGRYLLISSSRPGGKPCPLHGKWCGSYMGFWTFHMANENLQMIYWQSLGGRLAETILPMFDYYDRLMHDFQENARKIYACRGIFVPAVTTPESGLLKTFKPHIVHWTGAAAWIAQHYYDYYLYTGDVRFLEERALPFMRETALFYEDFFTVGDDGFYVSSPSNSPENTPGNYWDGDDMGGSMETTINATMDFALAKEVLTHLLEAAAILGLDADEIAKWEAMRERIPAYQINEDGAIREWMHPFFDDNYHHRHQSHIYPVFPGIEVRPTSNPVMFNAFKTAIEKRLDVGISEQTGWSLAHMANVWARMMKGNEALNCLDLIARSCIKNNFYTTHNDWRNMGIGVRMPWAPFQIDANMGWTAAIQEMLLFSRPGKILALPALPERWKRGSVKGLMAHGGVCVSVAWDLGVGRVEVELCSIGRPQTVELECPFGSLKKRAIQLDSDHVKRIVVSEATEQEDHLATMVQMEEM